MTNLGLFIFLISSINSSFGTSVLYEIKDLEVLEREKNFEEFLTHVNDIRPSERGRHWKEMYQTMAMGLVDYKMKTRDFTKETHHRIEEIGRSSAMINDEFYQLKRSIYNKKYFKECFKSEENKDLCETQLSSYWYFSKKDPDTGLDLAEILESNHSNVKLWPFYEKAVKDSTVEFYCQKNSVQQAVLKKLYEDSFNKDFDGDYKRLINKTAPENCFNQLIAPLKETLISVSTSGLDKEMALNLLESTGKLTKDEQDLYAVLYLLDGPVVGEKMNLAWKKIEALSESFSKRQTLMEKIQKLTIIPDKIFKDTNLPRHKAIINLFAKNFPEFLNYYGSTCIKFLKNNSEMPLNVSSSFQCNEFLKAAEAISKSTPTENTQWINDSIKIQYSALKK